MKQRIVGRVNGDNYEVVYPGGGVMKRVPLGEAREDTQLAAAIRRNGWEKLSDE